LGVVSGIIGARVKQKDLKKPPHVRRYKACRAEPLYMQGSNPLVPTNYTGSNTATSKPMIDQLQQVNFALEYSKKVMRPLGELEEVKK
jgi:hypothetical protein